MTASSLNVLFRVAAGPQVGFGHLARSRSLARALGVPPLVAMRASLRTKATAASMGWTLVNGTSDEDLKTLDLDLIVVDDPVGQEAEKWVRKSRRLGVPVASIHDLGLAHVESDLIIDGSISPGSRPVDSASLRGPQYAILDPSIAQLRDERRVPMLGRVVIALGGGAHVHPLASRLSKAIASRLPAADMRVACGFAPPANLPALTRGLWLPTPNGLATELANATVVVVAGGVTIYEACALRIPIVALPVTAAQHATTRALACRGAAVDCGWPIDQLTIDRVADAVAALFTHARLRERLSREAGRLVDGEGAFRVAERLRELAGGVARQEASDAA
jgi:UDP-2,4-diacetamido-2,4,6-trideoxy-beta-L-altropyranose hydrolase